jgi:ATP-dependent DNA helicase DinG
MSNVLSLADARATSHVPDSVQDCYDKLASLGSAFTVRAKQKDLSRAIRDALVDDVPIVGEAPTGTGKTIAYLIGGLTGARQLEQNFEGEPFPIVIATHTVGLQAQVISNDLPKIFEAGLASPEDAVIAKGRNRYFCIQSAERLLSGDAGDTQFDMFDPDSNTQVDGVEEIREMSESWHGAAWKGDIDSYGDKRPVFWAKVQASSDTCIGKKCDYYDECPYFIERRRVAKAKIVVANQDLVLADLMAQLSEQEPVFPFTRYILLIDEAHHLPDKAMEAGAAMGDLVDTLAKLGTMHSVAKKFFATSEMARFLDSKDISHETFGTNGLKAALEYGIDAVKRVAVDPESGFRRFPNGEVPTDLANAMKGLMVILGDLREGVAKASATLKNSNIAKNDASQKTPVAEALYEASMMTGVLTKLWKALRLFTNDDKAVRWVRVKDTVVEICVSPLEASAILRNLMWENPRVRVAMVSATVQDLEGFSRYIKRCGLPPETRTAAIPSHFPYGECQLIFEDMKHSPRQDEREKFIKELSEKMPRVIDPGEGTLVIFNSKAVLDTLAPVIRKAFPGKVLVQNEMGFKQLVHEHRARIDRGGGNILMGLATVSEGLDLPGNYCSHVIVTTIPFSVPTNPVEEERAELLGNSYFYKHALPDAYVKLVQMVGRLMRRETDRGRITLFDNRLWRTNYGWKLIEALPKFKRKRSYRASTTQAAPARAS